MTFGPLNNLTLYNDRSFSGPLYAGPHYYYSDPEPGRILRGRPSSLPRFGRVATSRLQNPHLKCDRNLGWNIDWAVAFVVDHVKEKSDAAEALRNIRIRAATLERNGLVREIPDRIFNKLDETLFAGHLRNAVYLECSGLESDVSGATYTHNWGPHPEVKRISIILNSDILDCARAKDIVAILIHHMIHAYFLVACGPQKEQEVDYGRLSHGQHFGKVMTAIRQLSAAHGKELTGLDYGHTLEDRYEVDGYYRPRRRPSRDSDSEREKWYCSHCHPNVYEIPDLELDRWYTKNIHPMLDQPCKAIRSATVQIYNDRCHELESAPRARLPPSAKTLELIYKDTPTLIDATHLDALLSLKRTFANSKSRLLTLGPKDTSDRTFLRLLEFIHTRSYRPDPLAMSSSRKAPPIIKPSAGTPEPFVLFDVQFANLGAALGCDEAVAYALKRMDAYGIMSEDPVAVLEEIYRGREPERKMKEWVSAFLVARPEGGGVPNLVRLESEDRAWRERLRDAMERSGGLENEVRKAWGELRAPLDGGLLGLGGLGIGFPFQQQQQTQQLLLGAGGLGTPNINLASPVPNINVAHLQLANLLSSLSPYNTNPLAALELEQLKAVQRKQIKDLEREKRNMKLRESQAQVQVAAMLEAMCGRGMGRGFVDDDEEDEEDDRY